jgi:hypothetical protein
MLWLVVPGGIDARVVFWNVDQVFLFWGEADWPIQLAARHRQLTISKDEFLRQGFEDEFEDELLGQVVFTSCWGDALKTIWPCADEQD